MCGHSSPLSTKLLIFQTAKVGGREGGREEGREGESLALVMADTACHSSHSMSGNKTRAPVSTRRGHGTMNE